MMYSFFSPFCLSIIFSFGVCWLDRVFLPYHWLEDIPRLWRFQNVSKIMCHVISADRAFLFLLGHMWHNDSCATVYEY